MFVCLYLCLCELRQLDMKLWFSTWMKTVSTLAFVLSHPETGFDFEFLSCRLDQTADLVARYASISGWERQVIIKWWKFNLHNIKYGKWAQRTEQSQRSESSDRRGGSGKQFCCSGDDVGRQFGTFYVPLCERLSVCVCFCVCGCGLLLCRLGQVAWFTFSSRWRQILSVCVCVRIKVHTFWRQCFLFYTAVCM